MTNVTSKLLPFTVAILLATLCGPVFARAQNTNTTIQEGRININRTYQCGDSNNNTTYQSGQININHTIQRCGNNRNQTGQFGGISHNKTDQGKGFKRVLKKRINSKRRKSKRSRDNDAAQERRRKTGLSMYRRSSGAGK